MPTLEQRVLIEFLAGEISGKVNLSEKELKTADWEEVLKEAKAQAVPIMAAESAVKYKNFIPNFKEWELTAAKLHAYNFRVCLEEQKLNKIMQGNPFCVLKGMSAASYYKNPKDRCLGDIDFLIEPSQRTEIEELLSQNGYQNWNVEHICHVVFKKGYAHLEMHFEISGIPYGVPGKIVREFMHGAVKQTEKSRIGNFEFPKPKDIYHGLIILLHMQHHMLGEGLGLRHICDWACYVNKTQNEPFWQELLELFRKIGILTYAKVMTKISSMYFHINCPEWADSADEELCKDVMKDVLTGGNFGRKDRIRANSGMMVSEHGKSGTKHGKITNLYFTLHHATPVIFPIVKKVPILYPFLDSYRALLYLVRIAKGERKSLLKMIPLADERKSVYERLHLFEIEGNRENL
ncbi:MAG: nucleotidyltransferase family protein [Acutalibacteraceae bacterium]|nr:nucleotidyltransferase family protein [Acutalibacteraceae bacterium]